MTVFDPLRDFFHRRRAAQLTEQASTVQLVVERSESLRGHFVFPGPDISALIQLDGQRVGRINYGLSPLDDRVYISDLHISSAHRRCGIGLTALWRLWYQYQVPLTPMHEVGTSIEFWAKVRKRFAGAGAELTRDIRTADQDAEQQRWQHLVPEPEHERLIRELKTSPEWPAIEAEMKTRYDS
ncbi:MAG: N-acetyltransferase [Pseudomonadales bacterium]